MNAHDRVFNLLRAWETDLTFVGNFSYGLSYFIDQATFSPHFPAELRELITVLDEIVDLLDPADEQ